MKIDFESKTLWGAVIAVLVVVLSTAIIKQNIDQNRHEQVIGVQDQQAKSLKGQCDMGLISPNTKLNAADNSSICRRYATLTDDSLYLEVSSLLQQYEIALRTQNYGDVCIHATAIAAKFLQAKNEAMYAAWKNHQSADCKKMFIR